MFFKKKDKKDPVDPNGSTKKTSLITGIIVGGAVGSVLSLLFAPDKGKQTRKKVYKQGQVLLGEGKTKAEAFLERYKSKVKDNIEK